MGKFHGLGLGTFKTEQQAKAGASRTGSACASPVSTASVTANIAPTAPPVGPLTLGHQAAAKEQLLPHMVADVVTEDTDKLAMPVAVVTRMHTASDNGKHHDLHGPLPQAQLQYSSLAGKMLRMVNELRATGWSGWKAVYAAPVYAVGLIKNSFDNLSSCANQCRPPV